jgi:drug/metabolite transporter (DMT)-like permease
MTRSDRAKSAPRGLVLLAFAAVYLIWGSTYLGIRFAVETLPPFLMGGARFLTAGAVLYGLLRATGHPRPARGTWGNAAVIGALLLGIGNGGVNWAEQKVTSGMTALIIAGTPLWFALFDWLRPHGTRPSWQTVLGIGIGFMGVTILVGARPTTPRDAHAQWPAVASLLAASMAWASGSLYSKYTARTDAPLMNTAQQMILGGMVLILGGVALGEPSAFRWAKVSGRSVIALLYLTFIGSLVGYTAYGYLLKATTPARASTYAYVNPVIALFLGWALAHESLNRTMLLAAGVIVLGVIVITTRRTPRAVQIPAGPCNELG